MVGDQPSSSLQTALFTPWCSLLHLVTCFWWEIVSFSIATRTSGSWWSCSGCETSILPAGQSQKTSQAGPWTSSLQYYLSRFLCSDKSSLRLWPERCAKVPHDHNKCHRPGQLYILTFICTKPYMLITAHWKVLTNPTQCGNMQRKTRQQRGPRSTRLQPLKQFWKTSFEPKSQTRLSWMFSCWWAVSGPIWRGCGPVSHSLLDRSESSKQSQLTALDTVSNFSVQKNSMSEC